MEVNLSSCYSNRYLIWWKEDRSTHFMATRYVSRTQNSEPMERAFRQLLPYKEDSESKSLSS